MDNPLDLFRRRRPRVSVLRLEGVIGSGVVRIEIGQTYPLRDVAQAHRDLEGRRTVGSTVLIP